MRRCVLSAGCALAIAGLAVACGGGDSPTPTNPSGNPPNGSALTINIVGDRGNQSFSPNPAQDDSSNMVSWRNSDNQVHRIVANDGSFDTGNISAGASSAAVRISGDGTNYHCSLHPGMVGTIRSTGGTAPPCTGLYC
jgi:plastocyanin